MVGVTDMASGFSLRVGDVSLRSDAPADLHSVIGSIYFEIGDFTFPARGWTDRVLTVLESWIFPLRCLFQNQTSQAKLMFAESSDGIIARAIGGGALELTFMRDAVEETDEVLRVTVQAADLVDELARSAEQLRATIQQGGWERLDVHVAEIRRLRLLLAT